MRLFVAACPPPGAVRHLRAAIAADDARLTPVEGWHVTLLFLGEVPDDQPVRAALDQVSLPNPIPLRLAGADRFGAAIWAGVEGDRAALADLQTTLKAALRIHDSRPFHPHLTVAYDRNPAQRRRKSKGWPEDADRQLRRDPTESRSGPKISRQQPHEGRAQEGPASEIGRHEGRQQGESAPAIGRHAGRPQKEPGKHQDRHQPESAPAFNSQQGRPQEEDIQQALASYTGPSWTVAGFTLFCSHHATGGGYEPLQTWG